MVIRQGDVYWVDFGRPRGSAPGYRRPCVVIQNNVFNRSPITTAVVCALTSNLRRAEAPGNVQLRRGEANLSKRRVANISQLYTVDRSSLGGKIGTLAPERFLEIVSGIHLLLEPRDVD